MLKAWVISSCAANMTFFMFWCVLIMVALASSVDCKFTCGKCRKSNTKACKNWNTEQNVYKDYNVEGNLGKSECFARRTPMNKWPRELGVSVSHGPQPTPVQERCMVTYNEEQVKTNVEKGILLNCGVKVKCSGASVRAVTSADHSASAKWVYYVVGDNRCTLHTRVRCPFYVYACYPAN